MSFKTGLDTSLIRMHLGRGKKLDDAVTAFEKELNGGKTWNEALQACKCPADFENHKANGWQVHSDTWSAWNNFRGSEHWPIQKEVEALNP